jgi:hypothetical protein
MLGLHLERGCGYFVTIFQYRQFKFITTVIYLIQRRINPGISISSLWYNARSDGAKQLPQQYFPQLQMMGLQNLKVIKSAKREKKHNEQTSTALMLQTCIREVLGSNIGQDIGYSEWGLCWFYSFPKRKCRKVFWLGYIRFLPNRFQFNSHPSIGHYTVQKRIASHSKL